jgi:hypothetical protein
LLAPSPLYNKNVITHITKITSPILRTLSTQPKVNKHLKLLFLQYLFGPLLIYDLRFSIDQDRQGWGPVGGDERDVDEGWDYGAGERDGTR